jgi:hypothetical protein
MKNEAARQHGSCCFHAFVGVFSTKKLQAIKTAGTPFL